MKHIKYIRMSVYREVRGSVINGAKNKRKQNKYKKFKNDKPRLDGELCAKLKHDWLCRSSYMCLRSMRGAGGGIYGLYLLFFS